MSTTTHPTVQCSHCGQTLTLTDGQLQQLAELPVGSRAAARAAICDGWIVFIGSAGVNDFALCPTALDEPTTDIPCPAWCTEQPGHGFHDGRRFHNRDLGIVGGTKIGLDIAAGETLIDGQPVADGPARIRIVIDDEEFDAEQVEELAHELIGAAALLRTIITGRRSSLADAIHSVEAQQ